VGLTGSALFALGLRQEFPLACVLGTAGLALAVPAATNLSWGRMLGVGGGRRAVDIQKAITIGGPPERVFPFFARYDTFPRFMRYVREVHDLGHGRSRWVVAGPVGVPVSWEATVTHFEPNRLIAWKSAPGSAVANAGIIRFEPAPDGATRVTIRLSYNPPGGALGHLAALLFGADPKSEMDEDLTRLKSLIEEGTTSAPGKPDVARQDVVPATSASPGVAASSV
jgi:uncharacterized membrane protein